MGEGGGGAGRRGGRRNNLSPEPTQGDISRSTRYREYNIFSLERAQCASKTTLSSALPEARRGPGGQCSSSTLLGERRERIFYTLLHKICFFIFPQRPRRHTSSSSSVATSACGIASAVGGAGSGGGKRSASSMASASVATVPNGDEEDEQPPRHNK